MMHFYEFAEDSSGLRRSGGAECAIVCRLLRRKFTGIVSRELHAKGLNVTVSSRNNIAEIT